MPLLRKPANLVKVGTVALTLIAATLASHQPSVAASSRVDSASFPSVSDVYAQGKRDMDSLFRSTQWLQAT